MIAIVIGTLMVVAAATVIAPALRSNSSAIRLQISTSLGQELLESVRVLGESNWPLISNLTTGPGTTYYLNATSSPFLIATGTENIVIATTTFVRYFYVEDVGRGSGFISGATTDPSTKKLTVVVGPAAGPTSSIATYLTRSRNAIWKQTDWSGGGDEVSALVVPNNRFVTSSDINSTIVPGSLFINSITSDRNTYLHFDGDDDFVQLPSDIFDSLSEGTIEAWVLVDSATHGGPPSGISSEMRWFYNGNVDDDSGYCHNASDCLELYVVDGFMGFGIQESGGDFYESGADTDATPHVGVWRHIALVVSSSTGNTLYIDGSTPADLDYWTFAGTAATKLFFDDVAAGTTRIFIGNGEIDSGYNYYVYDTFYGGIDEVRVWNRPLSQSEIINNMYRELSGSESGLVGYWKFNEGSGQTVYDRSSGHHDGWLGFLATSTDSGDPTWVNMP